MRFEVFLVRSLSGFPILFEYNFKVFVKLTNGFAKKSFAQKFLQCFEGVGWPF